MTSSKGPPGFTLVEVLSAMVILSVGLFAMASVTAGVMKSNAYSRQLTTATILAREKMERIRGQGYGGFLANLGKTIEPYGDMVDYPTFKRVTHVKRVGNNNDKMKCITVTVFWAGDTHQVVLATMIGE